jgi:hypothetical protein
VSDTFTNSASAKARAELHFATSDAYFASVVNQTVTMAGELEELFSAIRWAYHVRAALPAEKRWEKYFAVIVGIASADSIVAVQAEGTGGTLAIAASGRGKTPTTAAAISATAKVIHDDQSLTKLWRAPANGYAFFALSLQPSIFRRWDREAIEAVRLHGDVTTRRPESYSDWARSFELDVPSIEVDLLGASGRPARRTNVGALGS